jgi:hypothetical protein
MQRAVTGDHTLFDECITTFRRPDDYIRNDGGLFEKKPSKSVLLLPFELTRRWNLGVCIVHPSRKKILPGSYTTFISEVDNPDWVAVYENPQLFGIALSSIISFVTQRVFKSSRDDLNFYFDVSEDFGLDVLSLLHPVLTAGSGGTNSRLSAEKQGLMEEEIRTTIELLNKVNYKTYREIMQSMRLVHLSLVNKREDFGLAYLLVVSAIESIAQKAVSRDEVKEQEVNELLWKNKSKEDPVFSELYASFKKARGGNAYLKERYIKFILDYAPVKDWEKYVPHPNEGLIDTILESNPTYDIQHLLDSGDERVYEQGDIDIRKLLSDSYKYRSSFVHNGQQPPHREPNPQTRFFQRYYQFSEDDFKIILLPNYQLLLGIARNSILSWLKKQ